MYLSARAQMRTCGTGVMVCRYDFFNNRFVESSRSVLFAGGHVNQILHAWYIAVRDNTAGELFHVMNVHAILLVWRVVVARIARNADCRPQTIL